MLCTRGLRGPLNHARTRPAGPRARLNPHMNLYSVSAPARPAQVVPAPAPHPHKFDPHPPRTIFFRPAATRLTY